MSENICHIISDQSLERGFFFESFTSLEWFLQSDFFKRYYDIWNTDLRYDYDTQILQIYGRRSKSIENLQRILVMLWYLDIEIFRGALQDIESEYCNHTQDENCIIEDDLFYFWVFWWRTLQSIRNFQQDYNLSVDGVVWEETRRELYWAIYYHIHNNLNTQREQVFQLSREDLRKLCS